MAVPIVTNAEIKTFVDAVLEGPGTDAEKAATIAQAAAEYGVDNTRLSIATGYTPDQVDDYLAVAQGRSEVSNVDIANYVQSVLTGTGTDAQKAQTILDAADQYDVDVARIIRATGYTPTQVTGYLALPEIAAAEAQAAAQAAAQARAAADAAAQAAAAARAQAAAQAQAQAQAAAQGAAQAAAQGSTATGTGTLVMTQNPAAAARVAQIKSFVSTILGRADLSDYQRAQIFKEFARINNVSNAEFSAATGFSVQQVTDYLAQPQPATEPPRRPSDLPIPSITPAVAAIEQAVSAVSPTMLAVGALALLLLLRR